MFKVIREGSTDKNCNIQCTSTLTRINGKMDIAKENTGEFGFTERNDPEWSSKIKRREANETMRL